VILLLLTGLLVACDKPLPAVTFFGDGKSISVDPASYRFAGGPTRTTINDYGEVETLTVAVRSDVLIDVPRSVAENTWLVAAFRLDEQAKSTPIDGAGSLEPLHDEHSTRVSTTPAGVGEYFLQVVELRDGQAVGSWLVKIRTTS
jgi:hypothetical protein